MTTMHDTLALSQAELIREDTIEKNRQFIHNALDLALSLGDFQQEIHRQCTPMEIIGKTAERISSLISFESSALYLVDEETADLNLAVCTPEEGRDTVEQELGFLIRNGFVGWAMRERRGITVSSQDGRRRIFLHVMSTYSRAGGLFIGLFNEHMRRLPDASLEILSIILRNAANSIESLNYSTMLEQQKRELEQSVETKSQRLVQYEKQLLQAQSMEAIGALAGGVAHQLNNALTGLNGYLDLIAASLVPDSEPIAYFDRIRPLTDRMASLTSNLLAYAQGGQSLSSTLSLKELVLDVQPAIQNIVKSAATLSVAVPDEACAIQVDILQMRMAILAIVENADEAMDRQGTISINGCTMDHDDLEEAVASELKPGRYACIRIRDTGRGMDSTTLRRIFEPFFSTKFQGRGLSMAAVFGIIRKHGGWITVASEIDHGTTVTLYLPAESTGADR